MTREVAYYIPISMWSPKPCQNIGIQKYVFQVTMPSLKAVIVLVIASTIIFVGIDGYSRLVTSLGSWVAPIIRKLKLSCSFFGCWSIIWLSFSDHGSVNIEVAMWMIS